MPAKKSRASKKDAEKKPKKKHSSSKKKKQSTAQKKSHRDIKEAAQKIQGLIVEEVTRQYTQPPSPPTMSHANHIMSDDAATYTAQKKRFLFVGVSILMLCIMGMWGWNTWTMITKTTGTSGSIERGLYDLAKEDFSDTLSALRIVEEAQAELEEEATQEEQTTVDQIKLTLKQEFEKIAIEIASSTAPTPTSTSTRPKSTTTSPRE